MKIRNPSKGASQDAKPWIYAPYLNVRPWRNGRRAALRSLWGNTRGSSSLLGRTNLSGSNDVRTGAPNAPLSKYVHISADLVQIAQTSGNPGASPYL